MKKIISLLLAFVFISTNANFLVSADEAENFYTENAKIIELQTELNKQGSNKILYTELAMLKNKIGTQENSYNSWQWRNNLSNISVDLQGGLGDLGLFNDFDDGLNLLTGQKAIEESLQLGSIGVDRENETLVKNIKNKIETYKDEMGSYPASLEDFRSIQNRYWTNIWWNGENQNIANFSEMFEYKLILKDDPDCTTLETTPTKDCTMFTLTLKTIEGNVDISEIAPVEIKSHDWEQMIKDEKLEIEVPEIATYAPADNLFVYFASAEKYLEFEKATDGFAENLKSFSEGLSAKKMREKISKRLGIPDSEKLLSLVDEFAFVSEDLDFFVKTDFAVIVKFKTDAAKFLADMMQTGENKFGEAGEFYIFATSETLFGKIQTLPLKSDMSSMAVNLDFQYLLGVLDKRKDGFIFLSDTFIRKLTGPSYRINSRRRNTVLSALETLQYLVFAYKDLEGIWPKSFKEISDKGYIKADKIFQPQDYKIDPNGIVHHKDWGTIFEITPINRIEINKITTPEKNLYERFSKEYQDFFREFFDPVGVALIISDQISFHTIILPLIENSEYNFVRDFFGGISKGGFEFLDNSRRDAAVKLMSKFDFENIVYQVPSGILLDNPQERARDSIRQTDLMAIKSSVEQAYGDKGEYQEDLEYLTQNGYMTRIPKDPITNKEYIYNVFSNSNDNKKNQCYRLGATFEAESNKIKMEDDAGIDPNLWEVGVFCGNLENQNFALAKPHEKIKEEKNEEELKLQAILELEKIIKEELDWDTQDRILDFFGDEVMFGIGEDNTFDENNLANLDIYFGLKLSNVDKAKEFLQKVWAKFFKEFRRSGMGYGMFQLSSDEPLKNEWNGVEYYVIPTGFINGYYTFIDNHFYFTISQKAINKIIGENKENTEVKNTNRSLDYVNTNHNALLAVDLKAVKKWLEPLEVDSYFLREFFTKHRNYLNEALTLAKIMPNYDGTLKNVEKYYQNIPTSFFNLKFEVNDGNIFISNENGKYNFEDIIVSNSSYGYSDADSTRQKDIFTLKNAVEQAYGDKGEYIEDLDYLVENGYITMIPKDPETGEDYIYNVADDPKTGVKNKCYRLGATFTDEKNKGKMTSDVGIDPNLWEIGVCVGDFNLPLVEPVNSIKKQEKISLEEIFKNIDLKDSIYKTLDKFESFALGFSFTPHGVEIRMAFNNPEIDEFDDRFEITVERKTLGKRIAQIIDNSLSTETLKEKIIIGGLFGALALMILGGIVAMLRRK